MTTAGIILAAGESRRMGRPKALLDYRGETFLDRLIGLFATHCAPVIAVLGAEADRIAAGVARGKAARLVVNAAYREGQTSSLQCGLRAAAGASGALFTLVDHPAVRAETVAALAAPGARLRIPRYRGRRGHPVYIPAPLVPEFLSIPAGGTARDVVERHAHEIEYLDVDDPGVTTDVDDPEAYRRLMAGVSP